MKYLQWEFLIVQSVSSRQKIYTFETICYLSVLQLTLNSVISLQTKNRFNSQVIKFCVLQVKKLAHPEYRIQPTGITSFSTFLEQNEG